MTPMWTWTAAFRLAALITIPGGVVAVAGSSADSAAPAPPPIANAGAASPRTSTWACGPGPVQIYDMESTEGFLKARAPHTRSFHEFNFARVIYSSGGIGLFFSGGELGDRGPSWSTDYPHADRIMVRLATRLSNLDACEYEHPVSLADPDLRHFPFLYSLEWGYATLTDEEVSGLRDYLQAGGFLMIDDFWGSQAWRNFEEQIQRVLPGRPIVEVPRDHILFRAYYTIEGDLLQIPNVGNGRAMGMGLPGAYTSERDGYEPHLRGIFDDDGRLMVAINWNTDLGDALEWAEDPNYPLEYSTFASQLFMNHIIYAMTH